MASTSTTTTAAPAVPTSADIEAYFGSNAAAAHNAQHVMRWWVLANSNNRGNMAWGEEQQRAYDAIARWTYTTPEMTTIVGEEQQSPQTQLQPQTLDVEMEEAKDGAHEDRANAALKKANADGFSWLDEIDVEQLPTRAEALDELIDVITHRRDMISVGAASSPWDVNVLAGLQYGEGVADYGLIVINDGGRARALSRDEHLAILNEAVNFQ